MNEGRLEQRLKGRLTNEEVDLMDRVLDHIDGIEDPTERLIVARSFSDEFVEYYFRKLNEVQDE